MWSSVFSTTPCKPSQWKKTPDLKRIGTAMAWSVSGSRSSAKYFKSSWTPIILICLFVTANTFHSKLANWLNLFETVCGFAWWRTEETIWYEYAYYCMPAHLLASFSSLSLRIRLSTPLNRPQNVFCFCLVSAFGFCSTTPTFGRGLRMAKWFSLGGYPQYWLLSMPSLSRNSGVPTSTSMA